MLITCDQLFYVIFALNNFYIIDYENKKIFCCCDFDGNNIDYNGTADEKHY